MKRLSAWIITTLVVALGFMGCSTFPGPNDPGWTTLFDGKNFDGFNRIGDANWRVADGLLVADSGNGHLVTKNSYSNFQIRAEFWANTEVNSGIFIRAQDPKKVGADTSYEVNVFDLRPDPSYGTGAIVNVAKVDPMPKAGGKWNLYEITANGPHLVVYLNGEKTADVMDSKFASGPFSLQYAGGKGGIIKWRKVQVRPL